MSATFDIANFQTANELPADESIAPAAYLRQKQTAVRILGVLLGVVLAPVILFLIMAVRLTSPGPGLYRQKRLGLYGREFTIFKLRSMRQDAEELSGPVWAAKKDSRITPLGHFLRWSHLDELPQIINVIRGEMDFVGPRPERPEIVDELVSKIPNYLSRHDAMPGITGIAQVNLEPDQEISCVIKKVAADRYYIQNANLWLDVRLLTATVLRILGLRYHYGAKLLGVTLPKDLLTGLPVHEASEQPSASRSHPTSLEESAEDNDDTKVYASLTETVVDESAAAILSRASVAPVQHRVPR